MTTTDQAVPRNRIEEREYRNGELVDERISELVIIEGDMRRADDMMRLEDAVCIAKEAREQFLMDAYDAAAEIRRHTRTFCNTAESIRARTDEMPDLVEDSEVVADLYLRLAARVESLARTMAVKGVTA